MTDSSVADRAPVLPRASSSGVEVLRNYVGGRWVDSRASEFLDVYNPARG